MQKFDAVVIGGGASGCFVAINLAKVGKKVCIVDKFDMPAKKLLATGNGRCNITNNNMGSKFYNQNIDRYLSKFNNNDAINFFNEIGIDIYADDEGRCYPTSNSAKSVQIAIINQLKKFGVKYIGNSEVVDVQKLDDTYLTKFLSIKKEETNNNTDEKFCDYKNYEIYSTNIIFACNINSFVLNMTKKFKIKTRQIFPSLVAMKTIQSTKQLEGLRISNVEVLAKVDNKIEKEYGEVLFKDHGVSGICIFNLSAYFARVGNYEGKIDINLAKNLKNQEIIKKLYEKLNIFENILDLLSSMFFKELSKEILNRCAIAFDTLCIKITQKNVEDIAYHISNFNFDVCGTYQNNQVVSGGVLLDEVTNCLESKVNKNMFFCGEVCDVDGVCGGYNLQWAWTSGFIVANKING